jgi:hypothetical protein
MRERFEALTDEAHRFHMPTLYASVWPDIEAIGRVHPHIVALRARLTADELRWLACTLIRHAFLIELVKVPKIETTKFRVRWFEQLDGDPRYCSFDEALEMVVRLIESLPEWLNVAAHAETLDLFFEQPLLAYEAPLDYAERVLDPDGRIHRVENFRWTYTDTILRTLRLRRYLRTPATSPDADFFRQVLNDKIQVKTYLTDRVLTGAYKTNREKRWETHPRSVHFALRRTCLEIEYVLVTQLCAFAEFPAEFREMLQRQGTLPADLATFRCPITLDPLSFAEFREALGDPTHGKSDFQVGHLNPLKLDANAEDVVGHTAGNISWISADGNRIQGSLSLDQVRELLGRIAENYKGTGL